MANHRRQTVPTNTHGYRPKTIRGIALPKKKGGKTVYRILVHIDNLCYSNKANGQALLQGWSNEADEIAVIVHT